MARIKERDKAKQQGSHLTRSASTREEGRRHENKEARQKTAGRKQEYSDQKKSVHQSVKSRELDTGTAGRRGKKKILEK